jgi:hypothetical protein
MESKRNPAAFAFFRSPLLIADVDQPMIVPLLAEFFVIRHFTRIQKGKKLVVEVCGNGKSRGAMRARKKWQRQNSTSSVKLK